MTSTPAIANIPLASDFAPQAEAMLPEAYAMLPKGDWRREDMVRNLAYQLACDAKRWGSTVPDMNPVEARKHVELAGRKAAA